MACNGDVVSVKETIARLLCYKLSVENRGFIEFLARGMFKSVQKVLHEHDVSCGLVAEDEINDSTSTHYKEWQKMNSLDEVLKRGRSRRSSIRSIGQRMNGLDAKMREAAREFEDTLETHMINHRQLDQEKLERDMYSFFRKAVKLKEEYAKDEAAEELEEDGRIDDDDDLASGKKKMVGYSDVFGKMKDDILSNKTRALNFKVLVGMAGIGKTALARRIFDDPEIRNRFDYHLWVTIGQKNQFIDILESMVNTLNPGTTLARGHELVSQFCAAVKDRRGLVVLDDVWNREIIPPVRELLRKADFRSLQFPMSTLLVTSRLEKMVAFPRRWEIEMIKLRFMNKDESWDLLRGKVFGEDLSSTLLCTPQLAKVGKNIADKCEGLPLTIVTVADILMSKVDETMTPEYWNQVAEGQNSVFVDAYEKMSKVLLRSYEFLPRNLKEYFLYMGVFPQKYDVSLSKLALLLVVEGCFLSVGALRNIKLLQGHVSRHMEELTGRNLVLVRKTTFDSKPKVYGLHSALWHSCVKEAGKNKFFHAFNKYADSLDAERLRNQRRLCVHNNVLFAIKDVRDSMASISNARSLLCNGPHHRYPVHVCFDHLRLLRVIDALTVRFYEFPAQVVELVRLRYLALTCDGKIPVCISKLSNLEVFIVGRYLNIVNLHEKGKSWYLPMEMWDMKQLQHLQVMGEDLPEPRADVVLPNLVTLMDANARNCTIRVLQGLPELTKLGLRIELSADDAEPLSISTYYSRELESLKCVVVNPTFRRSPIVTRFYLSDNLKRLSLNGLGCPWEEINEVVTSLPKLVELKLRCYAFRGAIWETPREGFRSIEFLVIEDTDLVHWTVGKGGFRSLQRLVLKGCYKLQDIPLGFCKYLNRIEIVDCSPSSVACVKQMQQAKRSTLEVLVNSSWDDDNCQKRSNGVSDGEAPQADTLDIYFIGLSVSFLVICLFSLYFFFFLQLSRFIHKICLRLKR